MINNNNFMAALKEVCAYGSITPNVIEERKSFAATYDIYSRLLDDGIIFLNSEIDDELASIVQAELLYLDFKRPLDDIKMYINSPGGSITSGKAIYDTMQLIRPDVVTICTGLSASMAAIILTAGADGKRCALPNSEIMIHQPWSVTSGTVSQIKIETDRLLRLKEQCIEIIAKHSNQSIDKVREDCEKDTWMTPDQALEYGLIDKILTKK